jgi:Eph receptor B1
MSFDDDGSFNLVFSVCPAGTFRSSEVAICTLCPLNSKTNKAGSSFCSCVQGHYRHPLDFKHMPCHRPPGAPTNLTVLFFDQTSAILSWNAPQKSIDDHLMDQQFRNDVVFRVKCPSCSNNVVLNPSNDVFNETKLTMTNLEPGTQYVVQIHSLNGPSYSLMGGGLGGFNHSGGSSHGEGTESPLKRGSGAEVKSEFTEITFTTESTILSTVFNVKVTTITSKEVELTWDNPLHIDSPIEFYEVRWFPKSEVDSLNKTVQSTKETKILISELTENTEYGFQIRCKTTNGWGTYSNIVYAQTLQSITPGAIFSFSFWNLK